MSWREIVSDPKTLYEIDAFKIWDVYAFPEQGIVFVVANHNGSALGEVHVFFKAPIRPFAVARFMDVVWEQSQVKRLTALITRGNTRMAAWVSRYGWRNTHEPAPLGTEVWEITR